MRRRFTPHRHALLIASAILLGASLAAAGAWLSYDQAEQRLVQQRTEETGAVLRSALIGVQTPLSAAAELAESTEGDPQGFRTVLDGLVGKDQQFSAAALFEVGGTEPVAVVGDTLTVAANGTDQVRAMTSVRVSELALWGPFDTPERVIGFTVGARRAGARYVVYAEARLPDDKTHVSRPDRPFADLDFALYLGESTSFDDLLYSSTPDLPLAGRDAATTVVLGDSTMTLVMSPLRPLSGPLPRLLPFIILGSALVVAAAAALLIEGATRRRAEAQDLAAQVTLLYDEQRRVADTLQRSLLPPRLARPPRTTVAARFWPANDRSRIGGDFYDLFPIDERRWGVVIGDVCGKGVEAATLTGLTRHTIRAAARHELSPALVLRWTHDAIAAAYDGRTFATACIGILTVPDDGPMTLHLALGGHERPVVCRADGTVEPIGEYGSLLGVLEPSFVETMHTLAPGDRLVFFTDGVTDAPVGRAVSMERLMSSLASMPDAGAETIAEHIGALTMQARGDGPRDDTAVLIVEVAGTGATAHPDLELDLRDAAGVTRCRRALRILLGDHVDDELGHAAQLATSELVNNALAYTSGGAHVSVWFDGAHLRVEVEDEDEHLPELPPVPEPAQMHGRGLNIVDTLASRWGMQRTKHGKVVWFELDANADRRPGDEGDGGQVNGSDGVAAGPEPSSAVLP